MQAMASILTNSSSRSDGVQLQTQGAELFSRIGNHYASVRSTLLFVDALRYRGSHALIPASTAQMISTVSRPCLQSYVSNYHRNILFAVHCCSSRMHFRTSSKSVRACENFHSCKHLQVIITKSQVRLRMPKSAHSSPLPLLGLVGRGRSHTWQWRAQGRHGSKVTSQLR